MKARKLGVVLMAAGTLCYIFSIAAAFITGETSGYRLYLDIILGLVFFGLTWNNFSKSRPKRNT